jgi:3-hydroxyacyl-[acyl-carrier-protein] dehydratase
MMEKALSLLPHGPEFRFLDRLTALEPGRSGRAEYKIRGDEPFLRGHFPGEPIFPGVLLVEAAAQLAGVVAQSDPAIPPLAGLKLAAMRQVKILGAAKPGETLELEARVTGRMGNLIQAQASASVAGVMVMTAELTLAGSDRPAGQLADAYGPDKEREALESAMGKVKQKPEIEDT